MARPGLEPGTPRFSGSRHRPCLVRSDLQIPHFSESACCSDPCGLAPFRAGLGLRRASGVPNHASRRTSVQARALTRRRPAGGGGHPAVGRSMGLGCRTRLRRGSAADAHRRGRRRHRPHDRVLGRLPLSEVGAQQQLGVALDLLRGSGPDAAPEVEHGPSIGQAHDEAHEASVPEIVRSSVLFPGPLLPSTATSWPSVRPSPSGPRPTFSLLLDRSAHCTLDCRGGAEEVPDCTTLLTARPPACQHGGLPQSLGARWSHGLAFREVHL
jgi:hypothetical protein